MKILLTYLCLWSWSLTVTAQDNSTFFEANEAYGVQDYTRAIALLEAMPVHSFARYFNLGCAYQKNGDRANAWIAFERAKQIKPYDKNLKHAFQRLALTKKQQNFVPFYQTSFVMSILIVALSIFFWLTIGLWLRQWAKKLIHKSVLYFSLTGCVASGSFLWAARRVFHKCITIPENATVHISPTAQSEIIKNLPSGTPLTVATQYGHFLHVNLKNGQNGWIDHKDVKYILDEVHPK
ncbi:MAG: hypothetical protein LBB11_03025 [Puniceicoccales bacterium]|jgi:tetratricopeptide (TPR) repeat protein|nr:hypothetical protein [Puniceicoccales bacterium]